jgi:hypothetical protein
MTLEDRSLWSSDGDAKVIEKDRPIVDKLITASLAPIGDKTLGHVCDSQELKRGAGNEGSPPGQPDDIRVYICWDGALRARNTENRDSACDG